jgi:hypothetical protein
MSIFKNGSVIKSRVSPSFQSSFLNIRKRSLWGNGDEDVVFDSSFFDGFSPREHRSGALLCYSDVPYFS